MTPLGGALLKRGERGQHRQPVARPEGRNVRVDDALVERVMRLYGFRTRHRAIEFALRAVAGSRSRREMLELRGAGWSGDLRELRAGRALHP